MNSPSNKHTSQKAKKLAQTKTSPTINNKQFDQKLKRLISRLSRQNICKQHKLIAHINLKLQVPLEYVLKLEELKNLKLEDATKLINHVPYLEWVNDKYSFGQIQSNDKIHLGNGKHSMIGQHTVPGEKQLLRLKYPHSEKTIVLTGMTKLWTQAAIRQFNPNNTQHFTRPNSYKKTPSMYHHFTCEIVGLNDFWIAIEADNVMNALSFKKFIRQRKKAYEEKRNFSFKEDKKRVRIVMQNEDFYTLLVDAMTQKKNIEFTKRLVNPNSGMFPSMCLRDMKKLTAFPNEEYQMSLKKINRVLYFPIIFNRPQIKQTEQHFTLEDVYSQDRSKRSDMLDAINSMNDLIEKADQGTQAESLGIGTHNDEITADVLVNRDESDLLCTVKQVSPIKSNRSFESENFSIEKKNKERQNQKIGISPIKPQIQQNEKHQKNSNKKLKQTNKYYDQSQSDLDSVPQTSTNQNQTTSQSKNLHPNEQPQQKKSWQKTLDTTNSYHLEEKVLQPVKLCQSNTVSLMSVREPQVPSKMLKINFSVHSQTKMMEINYTKMKRLEAEYQKKSINRLKLAPGIPEQFRQVSYEMRNKELFVQNLLKSMEKSSQKKQFDLYY